MSKKAPLPYKDVLAMPGSDLYRFLSEGKAKEAEQCYRETCERYNKLMAEKPPKK